MVGPRIYSSGDVLYGGQQTDVFAEVNNLDDAKHQVKRMKAYGARMIKVYQQPRRSQRMYFAEACRDEHMLLTAEGGGELATDMTMVLDGFTAWEHALPVRLQNDIIQFVAKSGTYYTPTLLVAYGGPWGEEYYWQTHNAHDDAKLNRFTPHDIIDQKSRRYPWIWPSEYNFPTVATGAAQVLRAGGNVSLGAHGQVQGLGPHWEIWAMAGEGGPTKDSAMTPMEAIRASTILAADKIGFAPDLGSIETGKLADFIVLDADPLADIHNTLKIHWVVKNGEVWEAETLKKVWPREEAAPTFFWRRDTQGEPPRDRLRGNVPFELRVTPGEFLARVRAWGRDDFASTTEALQKLGEDPRLQPGMPVLMDVRELEYLATPPEVATFASRAGTGAVRRAPHRHPRPARRPVRHREVLRREVREGGRPDRGLHGTRPRALLAPERRMKALRRLLKWMLYAAAGVLLVFATLLFARAFAARRLPPLKPWHHALSAEVTARDITDAWTLDDYLRREDEVFRQMNETVLPAAAPEDRTLSNRYWPDSPINPEKFPKNWNRTYELLPEGEVRGGALLIHGLTDSPYSVKAEAELLRSLGYYALCLRMPGHGTVPGALTEANWEDWRAAVRLGVRHVRQRVGAKVPLVLGGYSNGGALSVQYALDALDQPRLPRPDRILLFSPMIGVSPFAGLARLVAAIGSIPYFARSRWMDVLPEYIPFKYDSFPAHAAMQTAELTAEIATAVQHASSLGPHQGSRADPRVRLARGLDRRDASDVRPPIRVPSRERQRARAVRPEPVRGRGPAAQAHVRPRGRRAVLRCDTALPARARDERVGRHPGRRRPRRGPARDGALGDSARDGVAAPDLLALAPRGAVPAGRRAVRNRSRHERELRTAARPPRAARREGRALRSRSISSCDSTAIRSSRMWRRGSEPS